MAKTGATGTKRRAVAQAVEDVFGPPGAGRGRKQPKRIDTSEVQGPGSYILVGRPLWGELIEVSRQLETNEIDREQFGRKTRALCIYGWNWLDDAGQEMMPPRLDPDVMGRLTDEEFAFLVEVTKEEDEATKSSGDTTVQGAVDGEGSGAS